MKKKSLLFALLPLLSLASCNQGGVSTSGFAFYKNPLLLNHLAEDTYEGVTVSISAEKMINKLQTGEDMLVIFTRTTCPHCADFEPAFTNVIKQLDVEAYSFIGTSENMPEYTQAYLMLSNYYAGTTQIDGATPTIYRFSKNSYETLIRGSTEEEILKNTLKRNYRNNSIISYHDFSSFTERKEGEMVYCYSSEVAEH
ncbi:MAG: hypothetical protein K5694_00485, partial [Bacilli bacterium]|nr:hypothetical protein [Bacilli bacterium]